MKRPARLIAAAAISLSLFSCSMLRGSSHDFVMTGSPALPAAEGTARLSKTDDGNTQIDLKVKHLARPDRIDPEATVFVVWAQNTTASGEAHNLGALKVDDDLVGSMTTVTTMRSFDLYITVEPSATVNQPSGDTILRANVEMD